MISRRAFLQSSLGTPALVSLGGGVPAFLARAAAAPARGGADRVLVVLQLGGGNDGLNTVVPYGDDAYHKNRPLLRISPGQAIKINDHIGLHPRLAGFKKLLDAGRLAIVQGVGYPQPNRSHFRSMDIWQSAQPDVAKPVDGWLGRCVERDTSTTGRDVPALHLGASKLPPALVSQHRPLASVDSLDSFYLRSAGGGLALAALERLAAPPMEKDEPLLALVRSSTLAAYQSSRQVHDVLQAAESAVKYPGTGLAGKLKSVAQLVDAGLPTRIYFVSLDGFDTHSTQAAGHSALLGELGDAMAAFVEDLAGRGALDRVLVMAFSEFGRRVRENASAGTDHGAAAPMFLAGSRVAAGLVGRHPSLTDLDEQGDLKFHTDFREVYSAVLDGWLKCDSRAILGKSFTAAPVLKG